jgi:hypothetical protein
VDYLFKKMTNTSKMLLQIDGSKSAMLGLEPKIMELMFAMNSNLQQSLTTLPTLNEEV